MLLLLATLALQVPSPADTTVTVQGLLVHVAQTLGSTGKCRWV